MKKGRHKLLKQRKDRSLLNREKHAETSASLLVTSALLVVTRIIFRIYKAKNHVSNDSDLIWKTKSAYRRERNGFLCKAAGDGQWTTGSQAESTSLLQHGRLWKSVETTFLVKLANKSQHESLHIPIISGRLVKPTSLHHKRFSLLTAYLELQNSVGHSAGLPASIASIAASSPEEGQTALAALWASLPSIWLPI